MMRVAGYVRVSTEHQKEDGSHVRQRERLEKWADTHGHEIVIFEDIAVSGQSEDREAYNELMGSYNNFDAIVVRELSRFGRDPLRIMRDVEEIVEGSDTEFISLSENFDTSGAMGKAMFRMVAVVNGLKSDLAREAAREMVERRREQGKHIGRPPKHEPGSDVRRDIVDLRDKGVSWRSISKIHDVSVKTAQRYYNEDSGGDEA